KISVSDQPASSRKRYASSANVFGSSLKLRVSNAADRLCATEELVVAITAQYIYLGPQPVTLEMLKTKLAEAKGRNPSLWLVVKADQDAPVEQVGGVLAMARSLDIEPFSTKSSESDTKQLGFDWF